MMIRIENSTDYEMVKEVIKRAFSKTEQLNHTEYDLVNRLRVSGAFVPNLSLVYEQDNKIIGQIMFSKVRVGKGELLALAPISVDPVYQKQGIGSALVEAGIELAKKLGYKGIVVIGPQSYYSRFGFRKAAEFNIKSPFDIPEESYLILELSNNALQPMSGVVEYSKAFQSEM